MSKTTNTFLAILGGVLAVFTISELVKESNRKRRIPLDDDGFESDRKSLSCDLDNVYDDLSEAKTKLLNNE